MEYSDLSKHGGKYGHYIELELDSGVWYYDVGPPVSGWPAVSRFCIKDEVEDWLLENNIEYFFDFMTPAIAFQTKEEAMIFKLHWAGEN